MLQVGGLGDDDHALLPQQPGERDLGSGGAVAARNLQQCAIAEYAALLEWGIRHNWNTPFAAPRDQVPLRAASTEVIEDLVTRDGFAAGQRDPLLHVLGAEVADAVMADFAVALQPLEPGKRVGERHRTAPMQQVQVDA